MLLKLCGVKYETAAVPLVIVANSFFVGTLQLPAAEPSVRPQLPLARPEAQVPALAQIIVPAQLAFFNQTSPVVTSVNVPLLISIQRLLKFSPVAFALLIVTDKVEPGKL